MGEENKQVKTCEYCGLTPYQAKRNRNCEREGLFGPVEVKRHSWKKILDKEKN